jgi:hypothetical protein
MRNFLLYLAFLPILIIGSSIIQNRIIIWTNDTNAAKQKVYNSVRTITVSQIAFFYEESRFATSIEELQIGNKLKTDNYDYSIVLRPQAAFNYAIPRSDNLKSNVGGVYFNSFSTNQFINQTPNKPQIPTILCEANFNGRDKPQLPTIDSGVLRCGQGTTQIGS